MGDRFYRQRDKLTIGLQPDRKVRKEGIPDYFKYFPLCKIKGNSGVFVSTKPDQQNKPSLEDLFRALMSL